MRPLRSEHSERAEIKVVVCGIQNAPVNRAEFLTQIDPYSGLVLGMPRWAHDLAMGQADTSLDGRHYLPRSAQ